MKSAIIAAIIASASANFGDLPPAATASTSFAEFAPKGPLESTRADFDMRGYCGHPSPIPELPQGAKLKQAQVFIRHGDRTRCGGGPTCWPGDDASYTCTLTHIQAPLDGREPEVPPRLFQKTYMDGRNILAGNCMLGQLTDRGYHQQLDNGRHLREAYVESGALPRTAAENPGAFYLRSDDEPRTIASGQALFTAMYPPHHPEEVAAAEKHHDGAPIFEWHTMDQSMDDIFPNPTVCPAMETELEAMGESDEWKTFVADEFTPAMTTMAEELGVSAEELANNPPFDCLMTHLCHDYSVPTITSESFDANYNATTKGQALQMSWGNLAKYGTGPLIGEMYENMRQAVDRQSPYQFMLYSGHDTGPIMPLLIAFDVFDDTWPPYASLISMELYEMHDSHDHAVRMVYNGETMQIPGCGGDLCDWDTFASIATALVPTSAECNA